MFGTTNLYCMSPDPHSGYLMSQMFFHQHEQGLEVHFTPDCCAVRKAVAMPTLIMLFMHMKWCGIFQMYSWASSCVVIASYYIQCHWHCLTFRLFLMKFIRHFYSRLRLLHETNLESGYGTKCASLRTCRLLQSIPQCFLSCTVTYTPVPFMSIHRYFNYD